MQLIKEKSGKAKLPEISTVLLNWNRKNLLEKTISSYLETISVSFELIVVDNGSTDGSQNFIKNVCKNKDNCSFILLPRNRGGEALNLGLEKAKSKFLHVSENDLIYKPGWDKKTLKTFRKFPKLGQLSLYSPFFSTEIGGSGNIKYMREMSLGDCTVYVANRNIHSSSVFRRVIWDKGIRWKNVGIGYKFPNDSAFSEAVKRTGYLVAWNDEFLVVPQGFKIEEYCENLSYYIENCKSKSWLGIEGFKARLKRSGYRLEKTDSTESGYTIVPIDKR